MSTILNPGMINTKMREVMEAIEQGRLTVMGDARSHHTMDDGRKIPYVVMLGSAPLTRGNELMQKMVEAIPPECSTVIWRQKPELRQDNPFQRAPRVIVRMRLALVSDDGVELQPLQYAVEEGMPPIEIETYGNQGDEGYVLQPAN